MAEVPFEEDTVSVADRMAAEALIVDVDGFEGPLDVLLTLSRTQKVDLRKYRFWRWPGNTSPLWSKRSFAA